MGTEFLPELDEGDILIFVEMPPSIALEAAQTMLIEVRRRIAHVPRGERRCSRRTAARKTAPTTRTRT